jgi:DNA-binding NarL/FixJ family response regulator
MRASNMKLAVEGAHGVEAAARQAITPASELDHHARPSRIRVGVIDDHPAVVGGLEAALGRRAGIDVAASATTAAGAAALMARSDLDVILLDVRLPDGNGLDVLARTAGAGGPAVIVLATFASRQHVSAARRLGARGFALKTAPIDTIVGAVRAVAGGGTGFPTEAPTADARTVIAGSRERA